MHSTAKAMAVAMGLTVATDASALIRIDLIGSVYYTSGDAKPVFANGTEATAWFEYDENAAGSVWTAGDQPNKGVRFYRYAPTGGGMTVGDYKVTFGSAARMFVTNQEKSTSYGELDRVLLDDFSAQGASLNGRPVDVVSFSWQDNSATALKDLALPTSQQTFDALGAPTSSIDWRPYINADHRVSVTWSSVKVAAVPEPASWAMMLVGFGAMGFAMRRRALIARPAAIRV